MRKIKFRGLSASGFWNYGLLSYSDTKDKNFKWFISSETGNPFAFCAITETIGQFIGITDTDGFDIYEGDICRKPNGSIGVIKYLTDRDNFSAGFFLVDESGYVMKILPCTCIGNIHENPELLKTME